MITGIHHVSMKCDTPKAFEQSKEFYIELLGLRLKREWAEGIMIDAGNCLIEIFNNGVGDRVRGAIRHIAFAATDVDQVIAKVREAGYEVFVEPKDVLIRSTPELPARVAFCYGPLGEEIEFFQEKQ